MRKTITLALLTAAVAALAVPAAATASWTHSGTSLKSGENPQLEAVGGFDYEGEWLGTFQCEIKTAFTLQGGTTTGSVTQFGPNGTATSKCTTAGLLPLVGCTKVESASYTNLPWTMHRLNTSEIQVTTGQIHLTFFNNSGTHCAIPELTLNPGSLTFNVAAGEMNAITKLSLSGALESSEGELFALGGSYTVTANSGTYGL